jgi:hypothetical protein
MPELGGGVMREIERIVMIAAAVFALATVGHRARSAVAASGAAQDAQQPAPTVASAVDAEISGVEKQMLALVEAMPEDKFNFSPESLQIGGGVFTGVRTFAGQVKHVATSNYYIWSPITGAALPEGLGDDGNGPANLTGKAEIIKFLKDSFALGHKAAATLTTQNMLQKPGKSKSTRLHLAEFAVAHAYDHYGQMVEYLRMNGIAPPASH